MLFLSFFFQPLIKFKSHLYYKVPQGTADALRSLTPLIGSKIIYYKNGECLNEGAVDLYMGDYFPTVSLFKNCELSVNFGPDFKYPPSQTDDFKYQGVCSLFIILIDSHYHDNYD